MEKRFLRKQLNSPGPLLRFAKHLGKVHNKEITYDTRYLSTGCLFFARASERRGLYGKDNNHTT